MVFGIITPLLLEVVIAIILVGVGVALTFFMASKAYGQYGKWLGRARRLMFLCESSKTIFSASESYWVVEKSNPEEKFKALCPLHREWHYVSVLDREM